MSFEFELFFEQFMEKNNTRQCQMKSRLELKLLFAGELSREHATPSLSKGSRWAEIQCKTESFSERAGKSVADNESFQLCCDIQMWWKDSSLPSFDCNGWRLWISSLSWEQLLESLSELSLFGSMLCRMFCLDWVKISHDGIPHACNGLYTGAANSFNIEPHRKPATCPFRRAVI